jgi:tetratricopeptide (TPR) repeat protein
MRLCIEVKKNRGEPISLLVDFLRLWYLPNEMQQMLITLRPDAEVERKYLLHALELSEREDEDLRVKACRKDLGHYLEQNDLAHALEAAEELVAVRGNAEDLLELWLCLYALRRHEDALLAVDRAVELESEDIRAQCARGMQLNAMARFTEALAAFDAVLEGDPEAELAWEGVGWEGARSNAS